MPKGPGETLDGGWDRRLRRGLISPERTIDLHVTLTAQDVVQTLTKLTKIGSRFEREDVGTVRLQPIQKSVAAVI